jgi:hypothetical protein
MKKLLLKAINSLGYEIVKQKHYHVTTDMEESFLTYYNQCKPFTMTSVERMYSIYKAVEYLVRNKIDGDFVECGVWRGGSSMMAALALKHFNNDSRAIFMYDTYEGMSKPGEFDSDLVHKHAEKEYQETLKDDGISGWCYSTLDEVKDNMNRTGYPQEQITLIKGKVEDTIPATIPASIALLRLDTDWYESTLHNLEHLFPRLIKGGILILDDYGHWLGARKAADEYFAKKEMFPFLARIDYTGRIYVKS